jgi:alkylation response protein AidB-like acyl-CoA dehydrogenase
MWHELTSDQELLQDTTARFLDRNAPLARLRKDRDNPAGFDPDYWREGAALGWTMLLVAEADGGGSVSGQGAVDLSLLAYEFGKRAAPGPLVDCNVVAAALSGQRGDIQTEVLSGVLSGDLIASSCLGAAPWQQPGAASLTIRRDGGDVVIDGTVRPVESGKQASWLLVTGRDTQGGMTQVLVATETRGLEVRALKGMDVTRRFASATFDEVRVPASALVGEFGQAEDQVGQQIRNAAVILSAEAVGAMDAAFAMTLDWAFGRYTFGRALASYQALKHRFADMKSWLEASHAISQDAAIAVAEGTRLAPETTSAAKVYIGEQGPELAQECVQLHGGIGVTYEHDLHFFLRRVTLNRLLYGTPADHRRLLASIQIKQELAA